MRGANGWEPRSRRDPGADGRAAAPNGFSLDRLVTLCAVVENGSIVAAAGPNPSRQSQFSRQIKELEDALGQKLFDRIGKTLRPKESGLQLTRMTKAFLDGVNAL